MIIESNITDKHTAYKHVFALLKQNGFDQYNTTYLTLKLPPSKNVVNMQELLGMVEDILSEGLFEHISIVESNDTEETPYKRKNTLPKDHLLSFYHCHCFIKGDSAEVNRLKQKWYEKTGSNGKRLFLAKETNGDFVRMCDYNTKDYSNPKLEPSIYGYELYGVGQCDCTISYSTVVHEQVTAKLLSPFSQDKYVYKLLTSYQMLRNAEFIRTSASTYRLIRPP